LYQGIKPKSFQNTSFSSEKNKNKNKIPLFEYRAAEEEGSYYEWLT